MSDKNNAMAYPHGHVIGRVVREARVKHDKDGRPYVDGSLVTEKGRQFQRGDYKMTVCFKAYTSDTIRLVTLLAIGARVRVEGDIDLTGHIDSRTHGLFARMVIIGHVELLEEAEGGRQ